MGWRDRWVLHSDQNRQYFEGLVMVFLIAAAAFMVLYLFFKSADSANRLVCTAHLRQLSQAMNMYAQDYNDNYPPSDRWSLCLVGYVDNLNSFSCPSDRGISLRKKKSKFDVTAISYWYKIPESDSGDLVICGDRVYPNFDGNHQNGGNVLYNDGHTKWRNSEKWVEEGLPFESY